ncbi:hypothetical protein MK489_11605 [Myxococcota bacterium]|nr:hypothetical protein [Myxococcota bacterium]
MRSARAGVLSFACFVVIASAFWWIHFYAGEAPVRKFESRDMELLYFPMASYLSDELDEGRLPLWNPYQFAGGPYLAQHQPAVLYPLNLISLWLQSPARALKTQAILHLAIVGCFTWLFLGQLGLAAPARLAGALVYMFSDDLVRSLYLSNVMATSVWLPAMLWATHGLVTRPRLFWCLALALTTSAAFLGGYAQGFVYALQFTAVYGAFGLICQASGHRLRSLTLAGLAGVLVLGLCAAQLLPAIELVRHGEGRVSLSVDEATRDYALGGGSMLEGLLGGGSLGSVDRSVGLDARPMLPLLTLPLALLGLRDRQRRYVWLFFAATAVLSAAFMLGHQTPVFRLYFGLPGGDLFRIPQRMVLVYAFALAVLLAMGVSSLGGWLSAGARTRRFAGVVVWGVALGVGVDAWAKVPGPLHHPGVAENAFTWTPTFVGPLREHAGLDRVFIEPGHMRQSVVEKIGSTQRLYTAADYAGFVPSAYRAWFERVPTWHGRLSNGFRIDLGLRRLVPLLDRMSVRYYVLGKGVPPQVRRELERHLGSSEVPFEGVSLIERRQAMPRAYAAFTTQRVTDQAMGPAVRALSIVDPSRLTLVGAEGPVLQTPLSAQIAEVEVVAYEPEAVSIDAECAARCLIVLTDLDFPGWEARVDGESVPIFRTDFLFRGVLIESGRHRIEYTYAPRSVALGAALSTATLILMIAVGGGGAWRRAYAKSGDRSSVNEASA